MEDESEKKLETQESEENVVDSAMIVEELADEYSQYLKIDSDVEVIFFIVYKKRMSSSSPFYWYQNKSQRSFL